MKRILYILSLSASLHAVKNAQKSDLPVDTICTKLQNLIYYYGIGNQGQTLWGFFPNND